MEGLTLFKEEEHRKKSLWISVTIHLLILLITLFPLLKKDPESTIDTQYSVAIAFAKTPQEITRRSLEKMQEQESSSIKGTSAEGEQSPQNAEQENPREAPPVEKIEVRQPKTAETSTVKTPPSTPSRPIESTIFEDNDVIAEIPKSNKSKTTGTSTSTPSSSASDEVVSVPSRSGRGTSGTGTSPGTGTAKPSNKPGTGTGQGNRGTGSGSDASGTDSGSGKGTKGPGTGVFDGTGDGIFGRQPVDGKIPANLIRQNGKITMKVCIDRRGRNTFVSIIDKETTIKDRSLQQKALDAMAKYLWEEDYTAAPEQCGKYSYIFKL